MLINKNSKRLISYAFYDKDGIVDSYVLYMLKHLQPFCDRIILTSNGKLSAESKASLENIGVEFFERPNRGLDISAHRELMSLIGYPKLSQYDEFIMMNDTIMGPVLDLSEMFDTMNAKNLDFWGLAKHTEGRTDDPFDNKYGYLPPHIQSYFIAVRSSLFNSNDFKAYWEEMPEISSYKDAVCYHESIFTKHFSDLGYKSECYVESEWLDDYASYQTLWAPTLLIKEYRCPFFKKRVFFNDTFLTLFTSYGNQASELLEYLKEATDYDTDMIWENILRVCFMSDIQNNLHLTNVLPSSTSSRVRKKYKVALHISINSSQSVEWCFEKALSMPEYATIFISAPQAFISEVRTVFHRGPWKSLEFVSPSANDIKGFIPKAYFEKLSDYDYVCTMHDLLDTPYEKHMHIVEYELIDNCFRNLLGSDKHVNNIIELFESNPRLGVLSSPESYHGNYYKQLGNEWGNDFNSVKEFMWNNGISCPISINKLPAIVNSGMFWYRTAALSVLFRSLEKCKCTHSSLDKLVPISAQAAGFYTADVLSSGSAEAEIQNLRYIVKELNSHISEDYDIENLYELLPLMETPFLKYQIKKRIHAIIGEERWVKIREAYHKKGGKLWLG